MNDFTGYSTEQILTGISFSLMDNRTISSSVKPMTTDFSPPFNLTVTTSDEQMMTGFSTQVNRTISTGAAQITTAYSLDNVTISTTSESHLPSQDLLIAVQVLIALVMVVGIPGNVLVITVVLTHSRFHTAGGFLVLCLSVSDTLYYTVVLTLRFVTFHKAAWIWNDTMCQFLGGAAYWFFGVSIASMSNIALSRYLHVLHPVKYRCYFSKKGLAIQISMMWIVIGVATTIIPVSGVAGKVYVFQEHILSCAFNPDNNPTFKYLVLSSGIFVPVLFTTICYSLIYYKVKTTQQRLHKWQPGSSKVRPSSINDSSTTMNYPSGYEYTMDSVHPGMKNNPLEKIIEESYTTGAGPVIPPSAGRERISPEPKTVKRNLQPILKLPNLKRSSSNAVMKSVSISLENNSVTQYKPNSATTDLVIPKPVKKRSNESSRWRRDSIKMTFMMACAFGVFLICIAPYAIAGIVDSKQENSSAYLLTLSLTWFYGCINPIIYVAMNTQYRTAALGMFPDCPRNTCVCNNRVGVDDSMG